MVFDDDFDVEGFIEKLFSAILGGDVEEEEDTWLYC